MKYVGSKRLIFRKFKHLIDSVRGENSVYVEPFVGGGDSIQYMKNPRIGYDIDKDVIDALILIRDNIDILPKNKNEFTVDDYYRCKNNIDCKIRSYVAFALSYGGKKWGGWCRDSQGKRDYVAEAYRNALKQTKLLQGCIFKQSNFLDIEVPKQAVVYCDIPYKSTTKYSNTFDYDKFYSWALGLKRLGINIFISEFAMPEKYFKCIWEDSKARACSLIQQTGELRKVEKLFIPK